VTAVNTVVVQPPPWETFVSCLEILNGRRH
jgi:hypothetical protein